MSKKIRELLGWINKYADDGMPPPPPLPTSGQVPKGPRTVPSGSGTGVGYTGSSSIKNMQKAIQAFADAAVKYKTKPERDAQGKVVYKVSDDDKRRNFNDFLAEQFSAGSDIHGDEYNPDPNANTRDAKFPTDLIQLNNVIDSLRRIGPGTKESLPDGMWDFRTNNAVRNVYALATALVTANEALGGVAPNDPRAFKRSDLAKLKNAIPKQKDPSKEGVSQPELANKAAVITPIIEKLTEFYGYYSKSIMDHPYYKRYITDDIPLLTVQPGKDPAALDANQAEKMKDAQQISLPYLRVFDKDKKPIVVDNRLFLSYLRNRQNLQKLMVNILGYQPNEVNNAPVMRQVVKNMIDNISKLIDTNKPVSSPSNPQPLKDSTPPIDNSGDFTNPYR